MTTPSDHLLLVALGPVQDFIASARRCQDLWFGSWLLSDLSAATARALLGAGASASLVFPLRDQLELDAGRTSIANKILAVLPAATPDHARSVAEGARRAMEARLVDHATHHFEALSGDQHFHAEIAMAQVHDLMEYLWVAVPLPEGGYAEARRRAEALLAARKNTRTWPAVPWDTGSGVPKSSLDGERESVLDEALYDRVRRGALSAEVLRRRYKAKPSERLSGVDLLKRFGQELDEELDQAPAARGRPAFHSTSHVASLPALVRLARQGEGRRAAYDTYLAALRDLGLDVERFRVRASSHHPASIQSPWAEVEVETPVAWSGAASRATYDGALLYPDRLPSILEEGIPDGVTDEALERGRTAQRHFLKGLGDLSPDRVGAYYGLLLADGDRLGRLLDELASLESHQAVAAALGDFAQRAAEIVREGAGSLVYAGGDDVLALVPLHTALAVARSLSEAFSNALAEVAAPLGPERAPTLSVGLALCHHMAPMSESLALARDAERLAKTQRSSLAILARKRGGADQAALGTWTASPALDERLVRWAKALYEDRLPDGVAYHLEAAVRDFEIEAPGTEAGADPHRGVIASLLRRVLERRRAQHGDEAMTGALHDALHSALEQAARGGLSTVDAARHLSAEIQIARLFLSAWQVAFGADLGDQP